MGIAVVKFLIAVYNRCAKFFSPSLGRKISEILPKPIQMLRFRFLSELPPTRHELVSMNAQRIPTAVSGAPDCLVVLNAGSITVGETLHAFTETLTLVLDDGTRKVTILIQICNIEMFRSRANECDTSTDLLCTFGLHLVIVISTIHMLDLHLSMKYTYLHLVKKYEIDSRNIFFTGRANVFNSFS